MANPTPPHLPPVLRQLAYIALLFELAALAGTTYDVWRRIPDTYPHQHLATTLNTLGGGFLILGLLSDRSSIRSWLVALACVLIAVNFVLTFGFR